MPVQTDLTPRKGKSCLFGMKRRPSDPPIPAVIGAKGSFLELAFLPFDLSGADFRPAWAERGKRRKAWDSLTQIERRVAIRLLGIRLPRHLLPQSVNGTSAAQIAKCRRSCLRKMGCESVGELLNIHRECSLNMQRKAWAAGLPGRDS